MINIYKRRKELDLTLEQIASAIGVSKSTVKKWEDGYIKNMRRDKIIKLANVLQISPIEILDLDHSAKEVAFPTSTLSENLSQKLEPLLSEAFNAKPEKSFALVINNNKIFLLSSKTKEFKYILDIIK